MIRSIELALLVHVTLGRLDVEEGVLVHRSSARHQEADWRGDVRQHILGNNCIELGRRLRTVDAGIHAGWRPDVLRTPEADTHLVPLGDSGGSDVGCGVDAVRLPAHTLEDVELTAVVTRKLQDGAPPRAARQPRETLGQPRAATATWGALTTSALHLRRHMVGEPLKVLLQRRTRARDVQVVGEESLARDELREVQVVAVGAMDESERVALEMVRLVFPRAKVIRERLLVQIQNEL